MSLYNLMCGNNPLFTLFLAVIDLPKDRIPRFRDVYTKRDGDDVVVVVHTRTGGGNREDYEDKNGWLAEHPLYRTDADDDFDSTFADFEFTVPEKYRADIGAIHDTLHNIPKFATPREKFDRSMAQLQDKEVPAVAVPADEQLAETGAIIERLAAELGLLSTETVPAK